MKIIKKIPIFLSIIALIGVIAISSTNTKTSDKKISIQKKAVKTSSLKIDTEMRGV